jgi:hypothetical protein
MNLLELIPEPRRLMELMKIHAAINIILCSDEWLRYHRYARETKENVSIATIDNGAGDHLLIVFSPQGTLLKGFDHESELSPHVRDKFEIWPGIYNGVPQAFLSLLEEEALNSEDVTFCIWRETNDSAWQMGNVEIPEGADDGSSFLLGTIYQTPEDFVDFADGYYEVTLSLDTVTKIYEGTKITAELIRMLNPDCDTDKALKELEALVCI